MRKGGYDMNNKIKCDTNCIECKSYYVCESKLKLEDETRDFWLNEREKNEDYQRYLED